mmetsp:Transcript_50089/g.95677  ORF Transcript_50089/g.95677 Transcript_50089/m.95677 type:complete len:281 (-) Transcript_50089:355-1197(-)
MGSQRFRPHQAHFYGEKADAERSREAPARYCSLGSSVVGSVSWTREPATHHLSPTRLPSIEGERADGSPTNSHAARLHHSVTLPVVGPYVGAKGNYGSLQRATHPVKGQQGSKKPTGPADWKRDKNLRDWAVGVDKRVMTEQSKKLRAANKDAQWVLQRREKQMREIQRMNKANQEAEHKARRLQEQRERAERDSKKRMMAGKMAAHEAAENNEKVMNPESSLQHQSSLQHNGPSALMMSVGDMGLHWQDLPPITAHTAREAKPVSVWNKPGHFTTKMLT